MNSRGLAAAACIATLLAGCSFQNKYEREADKITHAVMNNDLAPVKDDIAPGMTISRVKVAAWADELDAQGKLLSIKERPTCDAGPGWHCFDVKFEKHPYIERLSMDDRGKITGWNFKMAAGAQ
ncbi:MAG TPA: hypothetical protein VGN11_13165 [Candidatus Baltobacteraceae bacterium]|nr:hypothetical protein [Candidatus Baltobacteraceae bacterium]